MVDIKTPKLSTEAITKDLKSWPKYFRQTVVFLLNSTLRENFNFSILQEFFVSIDKISILVARLSTRL